jgi:hypothetical protein
MIKKEHIKQAIEQIEKRSPEIGYSLDEMLGMGVIDSPSEPAGAADTENFHFLFDGEKVLVNRVLFFNEGTVPIEQGLLIKYGELVKKQELQDRGGTSTFREAYGEIHRAGLRLVVIHEIDHAIARIRKQALSETLIARLETIKQGGAASEPMVFCEGIVDVSTPAKLARFEISRDSLMQVADINMDFFHVRFILNCLIRGVENNLIACMVNGSLVGLLFLTVKEKLFAKDLEIKYIATLRGKTWDSGVESPKPLKGVGTFLVAGVWLLWRNELTTLKQVVLDAELGARRFYESVGFHSRGLSSFVLGPPKGYLLRSILSMANGCTNLKQHAVTEIQKIIRRQVKALKKKPKDEKALSERKAVIGTVKECLKQDARPEFTEAAVQSLLKFQSKIPESEELIRSISNLSRKEAEVSQEHATGPCH